MGMLTSVSFDSAIQDQEVEVALEVIVLVALRASLSVNRRTHV